jgi:hypothetical protein
MGFAKNNNNNKYMCVKKHLWIFWGGVWEGGGGWCHTLVASLSSFNLSHKTIDEASCLQQMVFVKA